MLRGSWRSAGCLVGSDLPVRKSCLLRSPGRGQAAWQACWLLVPRSEYAVQQMYCRATYLWNLELEAPRVLFFRWRSTATRECVQRSMESCTRGYASRESSVIPRELGCYLAREPRMRPSAYLRLPPLAQPQRWRSQMDIRPMPSPLPLAQCDIPEF